MKRVQRQIVAMNVGMSAQHLTFFGLKFDMKDPGAKPEEWKRFTFRDPYYKR
jgi:hypothetical protein